MRHFVIVLIVFAAGCSKKADPATPDMQAPTADAGDVGEAPDIAIEVTRELTRSVPAAAAGQNRLEDPLLTLQNDSWFAVTSTNAPMRVQRIFEADAPNDGTIVGIPLTDNASSCLLGRMKWGAGTHLGAVWVDLAGAEPSNIVVDLVGLELGEPPQWTSVELAATNETHVANGRTWTRWEVMSPERFGWGYFEVCSGAAETVFITGPTVTTVDTGNALLVPVAPKPAAVEQLNRMDVFQRWWSDRRQSGAAKSRRP